MHCHPIGIISEADLVFRTLTFGRTDYVHRSFDRILDLTRSILDPISFFSFFCACMAGPCAELAFVLEPYFAGTCLVGPCAKPLFFLHSHFLEPVPVSFSCTYRHYCSSKDCVVTRCATAVTSQLNQMASTYTNRGLVGYVIHVRP